MFDTLREHQDHEAGCASEQQNAYSLSQSLHDNGLAAVQRLIAQGLHVVVMSGPAYCRFTDALLRGSSYFVVSSHLSRAIAERRCALEVNHAEAYGNNECEFAVYPLPLPSLVRELDPLVLDDDLPF